MEVDERTEPTVPFDAVLEVGKCSEAEYTEWAIQLTHEINS